MNHVYFVRLNPGWKNMQFQLALDKTFCPNPQPLTHRRLKQRKGTKINKNEHKFNKTDIEKWLPIGYNLGSS